MPKCAKCEHEKTRDEFYTKDRKTGRPSAWCKQCTLEFQRWRWKDRKIAAVQMFGGKCSKCGYDRNLAAFDFHHRDPSDKEFCWKDMVKRPWKVIVAELKKCDLLCKNCHQEFHHPDWDNDKIQSHDIHCRNLDKDAGTPAMRARLKSSGTCPTCGGACYGTKYCCNECRGKSQRVARRPSKSRMMKEMKENSMLALGRKYGVSDNAVRKWAKAYNLL